MTNPTLPVSTRRCQDKRHCFQDECERPSTPRICSICLFIAGTCLFRVCSTKITRGSIDLSLDSHQSTSVHTATSFDISCATHPSALAFYQKNILRRSRHDPPKLKAAKVRLEKSLEHRESIISNFRSVQKDARSGK